MFIFNLKKYISTKMNILFINHHISACGVYQYGKRLSSILTKNQDMIYTYLEIGSLDQYHCIDFNHYNAIIYNYHVSTLPWLNNDTIQKKIPNICIYHESGYHVHFDYYMDVNASEDIQSIYRPLFDYQGEKKINDIPMIGSFGFGFNNKGFHKIIQYINEQFDEAIIRLNITDAYFTDYNNQTFEMCYSIPRKPGIQLYITNNFMTDDELLNWLNENTINLFLYDTMHGRGPASVIDYALSVNTPIGISDSYMFRHIYNDEIDVYKTPIKNIISNGLTYIERFKNKWSHQNLINKFNSFLKIKVFINIDILNKMKNNVVLDDFYRDMLEPSIQELHKLVPAMMSRKIERANVQQAFVFKYIKDHFDNKTPLLCVGSYEDTCCYGLKQLNYNIVEIDPAINYDLHTYCINNNYPTYDVVFSVSVIEHVNNDDEFIDDLCKSLNSGGTCVLTCDFKNSYKPGDLIPGEDHRLYTENDLLVRFKNILDNNNCYIDGDIDYSSPPDFIYSNVLYSFATFIFRKH
jgi:hypothetical protein